METAALPGQQTVDALRQAYKSFTNSESAGVARRSRSCFGFKSFSWLGEKETSPGPDQNFLRPLTPPPTGGALDPVAPVQPRWLGGY